VNIEPKETGCDYCGSKLEKTLYFCPQCSTPYKNVQSLIPRELPEYVDSEMLIRNNKEAWHVFFIVMAALVLGSIIGLFFTVNEESGAIYIVTSIALLASVIYLVARDWTTISSQLKSVGFLKIHAWYGLVLLIPCLFINYGYHSMIESLYPAMETENYESIVTSQFGLIMVMCVSPAILEEIAFRGYIQSYFARDFSPWKAIAISSVLFSVMHFSFLSAPYLFLAGALMGWTRYKTGSLYPSIFIHFLHNLVVISFFNDL
jgi:membrane protease YdiL (CAAX protease family)